MRRKLVRRMEGIKVNHCKIENYTCPSVPDGEICVCIGCGNLYFRKTDEGCYCDEPCQAFWDMMQRSEKKKTEKWEAELLKTSVKAKVDELLTRRKRVDSSLSMDDMAGFILDSIEQAEKQGE